MDNNYLLTKMSGDKKVDESKRGAKGIEPTCAAILAFAEDEGFFKKGKDWKELLGRTKEAMDKYYAKFDAECKAAAEKAKAEKPPRAGKAADMEALQEQMKAMQAKMAALEATGGKK